MNWLSRFRPVDHSALIQQYLANRADDWAATYHHNTKRYLVQLAPQLGRAPDRVAIVSLLDKVQEQSGRRSADCVRVALSGYFEYLHDKGLVRDNPTRGLRNRRRGGGRDRVLSPAEIRAVWEATEPSASNLVPLDFCRIVRLLLVTGQRRNEIGNLAWAEIDLDARLATLPRVRAKNKRTHDFPLTALAMAQLPARRDGFPFLFGLRPDRGFGGWSKSKAILDAQLVGAPHWTLHDLRRSAATGMAKLGIPQEHTEAVLNHKSGKVSGVAAIYNRHTYDDEKRAALDAWAAEVARIVGR